MNRAASYLWFAPAWSRRGTNNSVRVKSWPDLSNRTFVLDAAVVSNTNQVLLGVGRILGELGNQSMTIKVNPEAMKLWRHIMLAYAERRRICEHKPNCAYRIHGRIPLSAGGNELVLCNCGNDVFPVHFMPEMTKWDALAKVAVRVAISSSFSSALVEELDTPHGWVCGKLKPENGAALSLCARCKWVKYCSTKCQTKDRKAHKSLCRMTASITG